jgi:curli biogenesis system outer membrane secretion channel CsgG
MAVTLPVLVGTANAQRKNTVEASTVKCENVPREQRPRIRVTGFDVTRVSAQSVFGKELASMLVNSLNKTGCFNVLESLKNIGNSMEEMKTKSKWCY